MECHVRIIDTSVLFGVKEESKVIVLITTLLLILLNVPIGGLLYYLAHLCDRRVQDTCQIERNRLLATYCERYQQVSNSVEVLRVKMTRLENDEVVRRYGSMTKEQLTACWDSNLDQWREKYLKGDRELTREERRLQQIVSNIKKLSKLTRPERMKEMVAASPCAVVILRRLAILALFFVLFGIMVTATALAPLSISSLAYCLRDPVNEAGTAVLLWLAYAFVTVHISMLCLGRIILTLLRYSAFQNLNRYERVRSLPVLDCNAHRGNGNGSTDITASPTSPESSTTSSVASSHIDLDKDRQNHFKVDLEDNKSTKPCVCTVEIGPKGEHDHVGVLRDCGGQAQSCPGSRQARLKENPQVWINPFVEKHSRTRRASKMLEAWEDTRVDEQTDVSLQYWANMAPWFF